MALSDFYRCVLRLFVAVVLLLGAAEGRAFDYMVKPLSIADGLTQNTVTAIHRDSRGFLWIGTRHGLNRFDNNSIKQYYASEVSGLTDNTIFSLMEDKLGRMWIVSLDAVSLYDPTTESFKTVMIDGARLRAGKGHLVDDGIIFGLNGGGIAKYEYATDSLRRLPIDGTPVKKSIRFLDQGAGRLLMVTRSSGIWDLDLNKMTIRPHKQVAIQSIMAAELDSLGGLWVAPANGSLHYYGPDGNLRRTYTKADGLANDILTDLAYINGNILVGTESGINVIDVRTGEIQTNPFNGLWKSVGAVKRLYVDHNDNIYVGTVRNGLMMFQEVSMGTFKFNPPGTSECTVTSVLPNGDGRIWATVDGHGLVLFDPLTNTWKPVKGTEGMKAIGLTDWSADKILFMVYGDRLHLLDKPTMTVGPVPHYVDRVWRSALSKMMGLSVRRISDDEVVAVSDTIFLINKKRGDITVSTQADGPDISGKQEIIYSSGRDLYTYWYRTVYHTDLDKMELHAVFQTPVGTEIRCARFDGREKLYVAVSDKIYTYNIRNGETGTIGLDMISNIGSIVVDGNRLWIGGSNRLFMIDGDRTFSFDQGDGVIANELEPIASYADSAFIYFGGTSGLTRINRRDAEARARSTAYRMDISLAEIQLNGISCMKDLRGGLLKIPARGATVDLTVVSSEKNPLRSKLYRFYLKGLHSNRPYETLRPTLRISDLPPGSDIQVSVSCTLPDGSWSEPTYLVTIEVGHIWWQTWWAIALAALLLIAGGLLVFRIVRQHWREMSSTHRQHVLESDIQILANINEGLRAPLEKVAEPINGLLDTIDEGGELDPGRISGDLERALANIEEMRQIVENPTVVLHPQSVNVNPIMLSARFNVWLSEQLTSFARGQRVNRRIEIDFHPDYDPGVVTFNASRVEVIGAILLSELIRADVRRLTVHVTEDELTDDEIVVTMTNGLAIDNESEENNDLRLTYANWLAELDGMTIRTGMTSSGLLAKAVFHVRTLKSRVTIPSLSPDDDGDTLPTHGKEAPVDPLKNCTLSIAAADQALYELISKRTAGFFRCVHVVRRGAPDAFERLMAAKPDIVIVEGTPEGMEICRRIRLADTDSQIIVIVVTSGNLAMLKERGSRLGGDAYLEKPFDISVMLKLCRKLLSAHS